MGVDHREETFQRLLPASSFANHATDVAYRLRRTRTTLTMMSGVLMLQPESTLLQLVEQLEAGVRDKEAELAEFERRARDHLNAMRAEIARSKKRIELFRSEVDAMRKERRPPSPLLATVATGRELPTEQDNQSDRIRDAARAILSEAGRPLMQSEIKAQMDERGIVIASKKVVELIRAALRRDSGFRHIKGQGWILVDGGSQE